MGYVHGEVYSHYNSVSIHLYMERGVPSKLREVSIYREVKVGGLCRFPMWDFVQVVVMVLGTSEECLPSA